MSFNCPPEERISPEIQRIMIVQPTTRFQPVEVFEPVQFPQNPEPVLFAEPLSNGNRNQPPRFFEDGCGGNEFVCSQNFTGRRFEECCRGSRRF